MALRYPELVEKVGLAIYPENKTRQHPVKHQNLGTQSNFLTCVSARLFYGADCAEDEFFGVQ